MWRSWKIDWPTFALAALCAAAMAGCTSTPSGIDPTGEHVFATPPPLLRPNPADDRYYDEPMGKLPGDATVVLLSPRETIARVGSEVILRAGVGGADGYLQTNRRLEWTIAAGSVGNFTAVEKGGFVDLLLGDFNWPRIINNTSAVGSTGREQRPAEPRHLHAGRRRDDSPRAGLDFTDLARRRDHQCDGHGPGGLQLGCSHSIGVGPLGGRPVAVPAAVDQPGRHAAPADHHRHAAVEPISLRRVAGPLLHRRRAAGRIRARRSARPSKCRSIPADRRTPKSSRTQPSHGTNQICIEVIRPGDMPGAGGRRFVVDRGSTTKTWSAPDLAVAMTGPASANVGQTLAYRIELSNPGDLPVKEATVAYDVPDGMTFLDGVPPPELAGNKLTWRVGELGARQRSTIEVRLRSDKQGSVTNCCQATAAGGLKATGCATTTVGLSTIEVRMTGPEQAVVGGEVYFEINITNRGQTPAAKLKIVDRFDPGLEHKSVPGKSIIQNELGDLAPGQSKRIGVTLRATKAGRFNNSVEVTGPGIAPAGAQAAVTVSAPSGSGTPGEYPSPGGETKPALTVKISGPEKQVVGEMARFTIELTNTGATPLTGLKVVNSWDAALLPKEATRGSQVGQNAAHLDHRRSAGRKVARADHLVRVPNGFDQGPRPRERRSTRREPG